MDSIERSIQAYKLNTNITFKEIIDIVNFVENVRNNDPIRALLDVGSPTQYLYLSDNGFDIYNGIRIIWLKFGWARKSGLPEIVNAVTGRTEVLRLSGKVYLFEPSHFVLFEHNGDTIVLYEYNQFAPRPTRLCQYLLEYYKQMKNLAVANIKMHAQRLFTKDIEKLLRGYDVVKGIRVELEASAAGILAKALGESESILESILRKFGSKIVSISWRSSRREELEISIDDILNLFHELENWTKSFVVTVKKGYFGRSQRIDLKKHSLTFRKRVKLATENGQILRSTDTRDAVEVLKTTIDDVLSQL